MSEDIALTQDPEAQTPAALVVAPDALEAEDFAASPINPTVEAQVSEPAESVIQPNPPDLDASALPNGQQASVSHQPSVASSDLASMTAQVPSDGVPLGPLLEAQPSRLAGAEPVRVLGTGGAGAPDTTPSIAPLEIATGQSQSNNRSQAQAAQNSLATEPSDFQSRAEESASEGVTPTLVETSVETTAGTIGDLATDVTTNRLPVVGDIAPTEAPEPSGALASAGEELPPISRHAVAFENTDGKPLMSIILVDDGTLPFGEPALSDFPYPLSFAIDVTRPDAAAVADRYRQAGYEVLAMTNLPSGASAQDTEVAMATYLHAVPQAVAIFEGGETGVQSSLEASKQLGDILRDSGHGLILRSNGLNTAQKQISDKGVPALTIMREIDGAGEDAQAMRRALDQAVFRAGQSEDSVVMVGRLRAETISALVVWSREDRANAVAIAPVSAALQGSDLAPPETSREEG